MDTDALYVVLVALAGYVLYQRLSGARKSPRQAVLASIEAGARIVDVRSPAEFASGAYRKARNIPLADLPGRLGELGPKDGRIVVYCASGSRSSQAARLLRKAGFTGVVNAGGLGDMPG